MDGLMSIGNPRGRDIALAPVRTSPAVTPVYVLFATFSSVVSVSLSLVDRRVIRRRSSTRTFPCTNYLSSVSAQQ